jgi:hypothetical protein
MAPNTIVIWLGVAAALYLLLVLILLGRISFYLKEILRELRGSKVPVTPPVKKR